MIFIAVKIPICICVAMVTDHMILLCVSCDDFVTWHAVCYDVYVTQYIRNSMCNVCIRLLLHTCMAAQIAALISAFSALSGNPFTGLL